MEYPSKLIEAAVAEISRLPGIGKKTALRLALHLLREREESTFALTESLNNLRSKIRYCNQCHNLSDHDVCGICVSHRRERSLICVVEDTRDVMAIENTGQYTGLYHVLGGVISPMNGVGPSDIKIESLVSRLTGNAETREVILALSPTMEGDTTAFYINKRIKDLSVKVTVIARGVPVGGDLEYADEVTLGRSITSRTLFS
ncbi:MAG TPA: recombination mediator RecR [Chryseosolibacter sp.]|nr:recombination mediator RecR [Chryseosolibacter sp.]